MRIVRNFYIGQVVGLGFGLILFLALLIGLGGRIAYDISTRQGEVIQTRGELQSLTLQLKILTVQRTDALGRYLETENSRFLLTYQLHKSDYITVYTKVASLLRTPEEAQALQSVVRSEAVYNNKAEEVLRLYRGGFPGTAQFLWAGEGLVAQDNLLEAIEAWDRVQNRVSVQTIDQARQTETLAVYTASVFIVLALLMGIAASMLITRSITQPISKLVQAVTWIGKDLTSRVEPAGPKEIAFLGDTINLMAAHLLASRQEIQQHKDRLERELTLASRIQASFMPAISAQLPGLDLAVFWQSARELGGDFYTCLQLVDGQRGLAVGDVNGKGAPAAMAGALAVGLLEANAPAHTRPETLLTELNKELYDRFSTNRMNVACCYAIMDMTARRMVVANAGCVYPYLRRGSKVSEIGVTGMPLGAWHGFRYTACSLPLSPGDLLLFSSDGLVEARNKSGELFGFDRLEAELGNLPMDVDAQTAVHRLAQSALNFIGHAELQDDMTLIVVRVTGETLPAGTALAAGP